MIVFDLQCGTGHVFEAWFASQADYDGQHARGLVSCPMCGDAGVDKAPMAPRIAGGSGDRPDPRAMMQAMAAMQARLLTGSEDVGPRFAAEARAIHEGGAERRVIHGQATLGEAKRLIEDGIPVAALPLPVRDAAREH